VKGESQKKEEESKMIVLEGGSAGVADNKSYPREGTEYLEEIMR
jgi:hypothetical protein